MSEETAYRLFQIPVLVGCTTCLYMAIATAIGLQGNQLLLGLALAYGLLLLVLNLVNSWAIQAELSAEDLDPRPMPE